MLDPQAQALLDLMKKRGVTPTHELWPVEARQVYRDRRFYTQPEPPAVASIRDLFIPGPAGDIPLRVYRPVGSNETQTLGGAGVLPRRRLGDRRPRHPRHLVP
jgi:acetyl esterase